MLALLPITVLEELLLKLQGAIGTLHGFTQTERLHATDDVRDNQLSAINLILKGFAKFNWDLQQDSKDLLMVLQSFGVTKVWTAPYADESDLIDRLIQRFNTSPNLEKQTKLPLLSDWLTALEESNDAVKQIMNEKAEVFNPNYVSASAIRDEIVPVYNLLEKRINANALLGTEAEFVELIDEVNSHIETQNLV